MAGYRSYNDSNQAADGNPEIRQRIIAAATQLFEERGFRKTSIDAITAKARTSKRAIYEHFSDKHDILNVVLEQFMRQRFHELGRIQLDEPDDSPRGVLLHLAQGLTKAARDSESMAMYRLLLSEAEHVPDIARASYDIGLAQAVELAREPLARLGVTDIETAGQLFYEMFVLAPINRGLVGMETKPAQVERRLTMLLDGLIS